MVKSGHGKAERGEMKKVVKEFEQFIARGNVVDLAVGVIIGGAFGKIVSSLVDDVLMPIFGLILGKIDFSGLEWTVGEVTVRYGLFIQNVVDFLIVAFCIFLLVRSLNKFLKKGEDDKKKADKAEAKKQKIDADALAAEQLALLRDIRDSVAKKPSLAK